jgi:hypothetical protein
MANRSDFYKAKLPRYLKRMLSAMSTGDKQYDNVAKKLFIEAHAIHVAGKIKRRNSTVDTTED